MGTLQRMDHGSTRYSLIQIFVIFSIIFLLFQSISGANSSINEDADLFHFIGINKEVQIKNQYSTFRCVISPFYRVSLVQIKLFFPNGTIVQYPMQYVKEGFYTYSIIFENLGHYSYQIIVPKNDDESYESKMYSFWISLSYNDIDSDGIADWWEIKYGMDQYNPNDASNDLDGDGYTNKEEFMRNTHPLRDNVFENAWNKLSDNSTYFFISLLFLFVLSWLSLYGIKKVHS